MSLFTTSSNCRVAQSIRKSGNDDTRVFLIFKIFQKSKCFSAAVSMDTSKLDSPPPFIPTPISGPDVRLESPHRAMLAFISGNREVSPATYLTIFLLSSGRRILFQLPLTHAFAFTEASFVFIPRPSDPASPSEPSSLHPKRGMAATIQFPHGIIGEIPGGGIRPAIVF